MGSEQLVPALMFMTLGAGLVIVVAQFVWFLRKRKNRDAAKHALTD
ncbi:MAG: hypothetical protein Q8M26_01730 [Pseudolabrys sp.]|nr:hypothetical protein [Pseudolabrys sp.]